MEEKNYIVFIVLQLRLILPLQAEHVIQRTVLQNADQRTIKIGHSADPLECPPMEQLDLDKVLIHLNIKPWTKRIGQSDDPPES